MRKIPVMEYAKVLLRNPLETAMCSLLIAMVVVTFSQVVFRYALHMSLSWSEEVARFLMLWLAMLGAAYGFKTRSHFVIAFVVDRFGVRARRIHGLIVALLLAAFMGWFVVMSIQLIFLAMIDQIAPGTQISMAVPYAAGPVGGTLMIYYILRNGWTDFRKPTETSEHD